MLYTETITVSANTTEANAGETILTVTHGVITKVIFRPRPGHHSFLHARVYYHEHLLFPTNPDDDLHGDTFPVEWDEFIELFSIPYELKIVAWNDDDTYSHTFDISFAILPKSVLLTYSLTETFKNFINLIIPGRRTKTT